MHEAAAKEPCSRPKRAHGSYLGEALPVILQQAERQTDKNTCMADETAAGTSGCTLQLRSPKNACFASLFPTQTLTMSHLIRVVPNRHSKGLAANAELNGWHGADAAAVKGHVERVGQLLTQGQGLHAHDTGDSS